MSISSLNVLTASLEKRLEQQELMSAISQSFMAADDSGYLIRRALKMSGEFMGVNQAFISKYRNDGDYLECLYEWHDETGRSFIGDKSKWRITPSMDIFQDLTVNGYAAVSDYLLLTHPNFETVRDYNLRAFLNIAIEISGEFWGILGFVIYKRAYNWSESDIHLGKLIAGIFSGVVSRNIAEANLLKAKEAAEQASKAKGEFLSRMSHEIRTPMNAIIGMAEIAGNSGEAQKMKYCLERIDTASKHLLGVINDILDMSKIEANKFDLTLAEFDFERMLMNITTVLNSRIEEKNQNLIVNIDNDVPSCFIGDELRLSQIISNLLSNAVKFTPESGTVVLNIHNAGVFDGVCELLFEVADNGIGISKEQQAKLFVPFEQAEGGIARHYGGTGLGLAISKEIVELMGGRIWIDSELGQGSRFCFNVKMKIGNSRPRTELTNTINKDGLRILVVENTSEMSEYFKRVMAQSGLSCDIAGTESAALSMIMQKKDKPYDIFFIDWSNPGFDGLESVKKIRGISRVSKIIIMISEADWRNMVYDEVAAAADQIIFKPLFHSALIDAINNSMTVTTETKEKKDKTLAYDFAGHTLLVAEDIEINREIIFSVLENTKITIDFAVNGVEAITMFENNPDRYSLILMDIQMPELDGYETTYKIRSLNGIKAKNIPIIAMTANVFREDVERCMIAGMNDHIGKPVNVDELLSKLDGFLHD